ncbi:MAG: hypothetical protein AABY84_06240 [Candidatus Firestonebacteria bacterium]
MMVIYEAFIVSKNFFDKGTDLVNEENLIKILFGKMTMDFQFASRINYISSTRDSIEVDIFKDKVLSTDSTTNDQLINGKIINYKVEKAHDLYGNDYLIIQSKKTEYEWTQVFGHPQELDTDGYLPDIKDPVTGKRITKQYEYEDVVEPEKGKEFLLQTIKFIPYDSKGEENTYGFDYTALKSSKSIRVELTYLIRGEKGQESRTKNIATMISLINMGLLQSASEK